MSDVHESVLCSKRGNKFSSGDRTFRIPTSKQKQNGRRAFRNSLPFDFHHSPSFSAFKLVLKLIFSNIILTHKSFFWVSFSTVCVINVLDFFSVFMHTTLLFN